MSGRESFPVDAFAELAAAEERSFWFRARNRLIVSMLRRHFPDARDFLELGTGTGFVLEGIHDAIPELRLVGSDLYDEGLAYARERLPDVELLRLDALSMPFENAFDVIGAFDVLEHIDADEAVLTQIARALRPGGGVLVLVPQHPWLWSSFDEQAHHVRRYKRSELTGRLARAGFEVERVTSFVTSLLPAMMISRLLRREPRPEHSSAGRLGGLFERGLDLERMAIERGISLPAGGSLLVVGRLSR
jgi:SAM-dependent methyltransferase